MQESGYKSCHLETKLYGERRWLQFSVKASAPSALEQEADNYYYQQNHDHGPQTVSDAERYTSPNVPDFRKLQPAFQPSEIQKAHRSDDYKLKRGRVRVQFGTQRTRLRGSREGQDWRPHQRDLPRRQPYMLTLKDYNSFCTGKIAATNNK